jgi:hypothetical protein
MERKHPPYCETAIPECPDEICAGPGSSSVIDVAESDGLSDNVSVVSQPALSD